MRQVTGEPQIRETVQQAQREKQVGGHAVAVCLHVHRNTGLAAQLQPAFDQGHTFGHGVRPHIGLQVQMVGAELSHVLQDWLQVGHRLRVTLRLPGQAPFAQPPGDLAHIVAVKKTHTGTIEAGRMDHVELGVQRPFGTVGPAPLHRPHRLVDLQLLHQEDTDAASSASLKKRVPRSRWFS